MEEKEIEVGTKFKTVQMRVQDKRELDRISELKEIKRVVLLKQAVQWLKKKYRIKDEAVDNVEE